MNVNKFKAYLTGEETYGPVTEELLENIGGWAAVGLMNLLNFGVKCMDPEEEYLEIGTFGGRSLVGALYDNDRLAQVFDPFGSEHSEPEEILRSWNKTINEYGIEDRITFYRMYCEQFRGQLPKIGLFLYDGNHDSGHTYEGLKNFEGYLADKSIIIVDDYEIYGGDAQRVFPGHTLDRSLPVKRDTDRWLSETPEATLIQVTPWTHKQAIIQYEKNIP